jgi:hypothetical protein
MRLGPSSVRRYLYLLCYRVESACIHVDWCPVFVAVAPAAVSLAWCCAVQIEGLRRRVVTSARPKMMYGRAINGAMLARLAQEYCSAMNDNQTLTIRSAFDRVADQQCEEAVDKALDAYNATMASFLRPSSAAGAGAGSAARRGKPVPAAAKRKWRAGVETAAGNLVFDADAIVSMHNEALDVAKAVFVQEAVEVGWLSPWSSPRRCVHTALRLTPLPCNARHCEHHFAWRRCRRTRTASQSSRSRCTCRWQTPSESTVARTSAGARTTASSSSSGLTSGCSRRCGGSSTVARRETALLAAPPRAVR